jgi:hypothetical protein
MGSKRHKYRIDRMKTRRKRGGQAPSDIAAAPVGQNEGPIEKAKDVAGFAVQTASSAVSKAASGLATTALSSAAHLAEKPLEQGIGIINASLNNKALIDQTTDTIGKVSDVAATIVEESTPLITTTIKSAGEVTGQAASEFGKSFGKLAVGAVTEIPGANIVVGTLKMGDGLFGMVGSALNMGSGILKTSSGLVGKLVETTGKSREKISEIISKPVQGGGLRQSREKQELINRIGGTIRSFKDTDNFQTKKNRHAPKNKSKRVRFTL